MPTVEFYYMPESPPCRTVEMVANMAGVTLNKHYINLFTKEHLKDDYINLNPLHKVPFIVDGHLKLNESRAIAAYLVNKYMPDDNTLYPRDPIKRALVDELLYIDMGTLYQSASKLFAPKLFGTSKELDSEAEKSFRTNVEKMNNRLEKSGKKYLCGDNITIADISIAASFSFVKAFDYDLSSFNSFNAYLNNLKTSIPKYFEVNDEPEKNLRKFIESKQVA